MRLSYIFLVAAFVGGCTQTDSQPLNWDTFALMGKTLELVDEQKLEEYRFDGNGMTAVTIGWKNGPLAAPLYYWHTENTTLSISEEPGLAPIEKFDLLSVQGDHVNVRRKSGEKVSFKVKRRDK